MGRREFAERLGESEEEAVKGKTGFEKAVIEGLAG
jgi:hypothetical protein